MKEYLLLIKFDQDNDGEEVDTVVYAIHQVLSNRQLAIIDIAACRVKMNTVFEYIELKKRFDILKDDINGALEFDRDGFKLFKHTFETLDEVEKAIKNKAFL